GRACRPEREVNGRDFPDARLDVVYRRGAEASRFDSDLINCGRQVLQSVDSVCARLRLARLSCGFVLYRHVRPYDRRALLVCDCAADPGRAELRKNTRAE